MLYAIILDIFCGVQPLKHFMYDSECNFILSKSGLQCTFPGSTPTQSPAPCTVEVSSADTAASQTFCATLGRAQLGPREAVYQWCCTALAREYPRNFPQVMGRAGDQKPFLSPTACSWQSHIICRYHGIIPLLCMENAVKSVLQLSQVKQPHLNPDSVHVGYLSRFPGVYCRRKATQIWSLNLDSFLSSYSHSQKKVLVSFCFSMDGIKLAA